jgi:acetyl esterase/lipase
VRSGVDETVSVGWPAAEVAFADDAHQRTDHATDHGVEVSLQLYPIDTHDFHLFWAFLPEAADALRQAGTFIRGTAPSRTDAAAGT